MHYEGKPDFLDTSPYYTVFEGFTAFEKRERRTTVAIKHERERLPAINKTHERLAYEAAILVRLKGKFFFNILFKIVRLCFKTSIILIDSGLGRKVTQLIAYGSFFYDGFEGETLILPYLHITLCAAVDERRSFLTSYGLRAIMDQIVILFDYKTIWTPILI